MTFGPCGAAALVSAAAGSLSRRSSTRQSGLRAYAASHYARHMHPVTAVVSTRTSALLIPRPRTHARPPTKSSAKSPPVAYQGAVFAACRMSERGTTGTIARQHPFIRAGDRQWQGSARGLRRGWDDTL